MGYIQIMAPWMVLIDARSGKGQVVKDRYEKQTLWNIPSEPLRITMNLKKIATEETQDPLVLGTVQVMPGAKRVFAWDAYLRGFLRIVPKYAHGAKFGA